MLRAFNLSLLTQSVVTLDKNQPLHDPSQLSETLTKTGSPSIKCDENNDSAVSRCCNYLLNMISKFSSEGQFLDLIHVKFHNDLTLISGDNA